MAEDQDQDPTASFDSSSSESTVVGNGESHFALPHVTEPEIPSLSPHDRRIFVLQRHLIKSVYDFTEKCNGFDFKHGTDFDARTLRHQYEESILSCLAKLKNSVEEIEDDRSFDVAAQQAQLVADQCIQAYAKILTFLDRNAEIMRDRSSVDPSLRSLPSELQELKLHSALLPSVPIFQGEISRFPEFMQAFSHAVHDRNISPIQKLSALRSKLLGTPRSLVEHFGSGANDYDMAIQTLTDYYTGKNRTAGALVANFLQINSVEKLDLSGLEVFFTQSSNLSAALKNLELPDLGDYFMFCTLFNKLPTNLRDKFIGGQPDFACNIPSTDQLLKFLRDQLTILRARPIDMPANVKTPANRVSSPSRPKSPAIKSDLIFAKSNASQAVSKPKGLSPKGCYYCSRAHFIYHCSSFKKADVLTRSKFVDHNKLCRKCLSAKHQTCDCLSSRACSHCDRGHHSLLHQSGSDNVNPEHSTPDVSKSLAISTPTTQHSSDFNVSSTALPFTLVSGTASTHLQSTPLSQ